MTTVGKEDAAVNRTIIAAGASRTKAGPMKKGKWWGEKGEFWHDFGRKLDKVDP